MTALQVSGPTPSVSVLVPVTREPSSLSVLYSEYSAPLRAEGVTFEFVFVFDGATQHRAGELESPRAAGEPIRLIYSADEPSESALPQVAQDDTRSPVIITLPSYPRIDPDALPTLLAPLEQGIDLVSAARDNESASLINRIQRSSFHLLLRKMVGGRFTDVACGVRAMRREVLEELRLYGDSFRFIPILARRDGFRVDELRVTPHSADRATRVYAPGIYLRRFIDLIGLMFLIRFTYKPLRFFGLIGSGFLGPGALILLILFIERLGGRGIADRPMLLLGTLLVIVGLQSLALGLIGEIVVHHNVSRRPLYRLLESDAADVSIDEDDSSTGEASVS